MYQFRHIRSHCSGTHLAYKRHSGPYMMETHPLGIHNTLSPSSDQDTALYMLGTALPVSHNATRHLHCGTRYVQTEMCQLNMGPTLPHLGGINPINPNLLFCISVQVHICPNVWSSWPERAHIQTPRLKWAKSVPCMPMFRKQCLWIITNPEYQGKFVQVSNSKFKIPYAVTFLR